MFRHTDCQIKKLISELALEQIYNKNDCLLTLLYYIWDERNSIFGGTRVNACDPSKDKTLENENEK